MVLGEWLGDMPLLGVPPDRHRGVPKGRGYRAPSVQTFRSTTAWSMRRLVVERCRHVFSRNHAGERERFPLIYKVLFSKIGDL